MRDLQLTGGKRGFTRQGNLAIFYQLGVKVDLACVEAAAYFDWLDDTTRQLPLLVPGAEIIEKPDARTNPVVNTGVYYDTSDRRLLETGSLLRTTSAVTHAFCAFKRAADVSHVRKDHRYVFPDPDKQVLQADPTTLEAAEIVRALLSRTDIEHPGTFLLRYTGIDPSSVSQSLLVRRRLRSFYVLLDKRDALRCPMDQVTVADLRQPVRLRSTGTFQEVELSIYPRAEPAVAADPRLSQLIERLAESLWERFEAPIVSEIKYQRAASVLGLYPNHRRDQQGETPPPAPAVPPS